MRTLLWCGAAALAGWAASGQSGMMLAVFGVMIYLLWRQYMLVWRLIRWAESAPGTPVPDTRGIWEDAFDALHRRARSSVAKRDQLELELERFRRAAEALPDGVVILDKQCVIEWMNHHAEACLGLKIADDTGSRISNLLREPEFHDYLDQAGASDAPLELQTRRNPGRTVLIQLVPFAAGRTLLLVRDVTQLQRLATMRRDFVANVSHELKTPLTVTLGFVETAIDALPDATKEDLASYLATAAEQARRMQHLIDDLLTLSSLETDAPPPLEEPVALDALLVDVRQEAEAMSRGAHQIALAINGPSVLLGSSRELRSAFANLAGNAVRYTPQGGSITMSWSVDVKGAGCFSVVDSGIGIAVEHIPRLTERFYRVDRGRSRDSGGTGLGLAIVKHVLERHQAVLEVTSEFGKGSRFSAVFPQHRVRLL